MRDGFSHSFENQFTLESRHLEVNNTHIVFDDHKKLMNGINNLIINKFCPLLFFDHNKGLNFYSEQKYESNV